MDRPRSFVLMLDDERLDFSVTERDEERDALYRAIEGHFGRTPTLD